MVAFFISIRYFGILFPGQDMIDFYLGEELCIHLDLTKTLCFFGVFLFVWSLLNRVPCVSCVSVWSISPRAQCQAAKSVSTSHIYVLTCQRANKRINVSTCQTHANFSFWHAKFSTSLAKRHAKICNYFSK